MTHSARSFFYASQAITQGGSEERVGTPTDAKAS